MNPFTTGLVARDIRAGRHADAVRRLEKHIEKNAADAAAYLLLAECHFGAGDYESSFAAAESGLRIEASDQRLLIQGARSADAAGRSQDAYELAGRLLETGIQQLRMRRGFFARIIEKLTGTSLADTLARANQNAIKDFDWAKRYRKRYEDTNA